LSILLALLALAAAGCGGEDEPAPPAQPAATSTPAATATATASPAATETPAATASPTATATSPEDQEGGAGDEEAARVPVEFTVDGGVNPPQVSVPAFLALELVVRNETSGPVTVQMPGAGPFEVSAGDVLRERLEGRRPGSYEIDFGSAGKATLISGVEAGP
jgi:hypothetical protein